MSKAFDRIRSLLPTTPVLSRRTALHATVLGAAMTLTLTTAAGDFGAQAAEPTWTIPMSGLAGGTGYLNAQHAQAGWYVGCDAVGTKVRAHRGKGVSGAGVIDITSVTFGSTASAATCPGPFGLTMEITADTLPMKFDALAFDARTGTVAGRVSGIKATVESSDGCVLTVSGQADATYSNSDGAIVLDDRDHLRVTAASAPCASGAVQVGDTIMVDGRFEVNPHGVITSP
ncbi:hypothetical protein OIE66_19900 [Nonomuraea sp. NBC_01738]|uniref:hypothetical protein n=1 Tax=Nonomuraea sp. NBC_01738 TaxID=2976003 RepID=UPI002E133BB8|nr:hypothetical protein OIE66_19900 [Nonomuraea sp. NBC_01738]